jgi:hypothetical protein
MPVNLYLGKEDAVALLPVVILTVLVMYKRWCLPREVLEVQPHPPPVQIDLERVPLTWQYNANNQSNSVSVQIEPESKQNSLRDTP